MARGRESPARPGAEWSSSGEPRDCFHPPDMVPKKQNKRAAMAAESEKWRGKHTVGEKMAWNGDADMADNDNR